MFINSAEVVRQIVLRHYGNSSFTSISYGSHLKLRVMVKQVKLYHCFVGVKLLVILNLVIPFSILSN